MSESVSQSASRTLCLPLSGQRLPPQAERGGPLGDQRAGFEVFLIVLDGVQGRRRNPRAQHNQ